MLDSDLAAYSKILVLVFQKRTQFVQPTPHFIKLFFTVQFTVSGTNYPTYWDFWFRPWSRAKTQSRH